MFSLKKKSRIQQYKNIYIGFNTFIFNLPIYGTYCAESFPKNNVISCFNLVIQLGVNRKAKKRHFDFLLLPVCN